jgi:hypothetical protein
VAAFSAAQDYFGIRWLPSGLLIDSSIKEETPTEMQAHVFSGGIRGTASLAEV